MFLLKLFSTKHSINYIPKDATQQDIFITKYPSYDGRGIKIAIIDSGIDLSLEGLQKTSEGLPKIIDCFDFTGAGNVDTSVIKEMDSENILIGLSGRKLKIPTKWKNPSGKWHLGLKSLDKPTNKRLSYEEMEKYKGEKLPEIDCIVWNDGQKWLACIETFADLENAKILTNFRDEYDYGILTNEVEIVYSITVHYGGNLLEIFTPYCDHGSSVAQVAAAYFSNNNIESNGLAPGAQIISMNVLDADRGGKINLQALKKALFKCIEMKVDIINYSISGFQGDPEIAKLITEMANNYNILFFTGSGNRGPFFSSTYACDIEDSIFMIGALLTSDIKKAIYKIPIADEENPPPLIFNFSSRGPDEKGNQRLDFVAPGAATVDIPRFHSAENEICYGTSISTPNAAGAVACLLSALKANSIQYSHFSIKFALFKTAYLPENGNKLEFGHGIIQIDDAFDYCRKNVMDKISADLWGLKGTINIYYIVTDENQIVRKYNLDLPSSALTDANSKWILQLSSNAEKYIEVSDVNSNHFSVKIDTSKLEPGDLHFSEIAVLHPFNPSLGPIFNIPVTVIVPLQISETHNYRIQKEITLNYEKPEYIFFNPVFEGSNKKCKMRVTALEKNVKTYLCIQYAFDYNTKLDVKKKKILWFSWLNKTQNYSFPIEEKNIYEICIFQYFCKKIGGLSNVKFKLEIDFVDGQKKKGIWYLPWNLGKK